MKLPTCDARRNRNDLAVPDIFPPTLDAKRTSNPDDLVNHSKMVQGEKFFPTLDSRRNWAKPSKCKEIRILVKMYRRRGRGTAISLYDPLPPLPQAPRPVYKNIVAMAVQVREYMVENPQRTQTVAGNHFGVTRARVSQLMTILEKLPDDFISTMKTTEDQSLLKRFSGKTLLRMTRLDTYAQRESYITSVLSYNLSDQEKQRTLMPPIKTKIPANTKQP